MLSKYLFVLFPAIVINALYENQLDLDCSGRRIEAVTLTPYYPDFNDESDKKSYLDRNGNALQSLQDYIDNRVDFVTVSMDENLHLDYGKNICIPELNQHFGHRILLEVRDNSWEIYGKGLSIVEICVRTETDSYDQYVNRPITLYI